MKLDEKWRDILKRAWSVRFMSAALVFQLAHALLPMAALYIDIDQGLLSKLLTVSQSLSAAFLALAMFSRFVKQEGL